MLSQNLNTISLSGQGTAVLDVGVIPPARDTTGGSAYGGMTLMARRGRAFAVGERSANMDTLFDFYLDRVEDPSIARKKDPEAQNRMRQDLQISGCLTVRKLSTAHLRRSWVPSKRDVNAIYAKKFERWFDAQYRPIEALMNMLEAIMDGVSIQEMVWGIDDTDFSIKIERMFQVYKDRFIFNKVGQLCLLTRGDVYSGELVHPWQFTPHVFRPQGGSWNKPSDEARQYWGIGLEDTIWPNYYFKTVTLNLLTQCLEVIAGGKMIGRYPAGTTDGQARIENVLKQWQSGQSVALPAGDIWGAEAVTGNSGQSAIFIDSIRYFDQQLAKMILGSTLINDHGEVGTQSLANVQLGATFERIIEYDRLGLEETINGHVVPAMAKLNCIPKEFWPKFAFAQDFSNNATAIIDNLTKLQDMGFEISAAMVTEQVGTRALRPGEVALHAASTDSGMGFGDAEIGGKSGKSKKMDLSTSKGMGRFMEELNRAPGHQEGLQQYSTSVADGHAHYAMCDIHGNGETDRGPDGTGHEVRNWCIREEGGHWHDIRPHRANGSAKRSLAFADTGYRFREHAEADESKGHWVTIQGAHVFIDGEGNITKGPAGMQGKNVSQLSKSRTSSESEKSQSEPSKETGESEEDDEDSSPAPVSMQPIPRGAKGEYLSDNSEVAARIKALRIPPAWTNVHISAESNAALQAYGYDAKGRQQRIYSTEHSEKAAAAKFVRVKALVAELPMLLERMQAELDSVHPADEAVVLYLIYNTGFRVGSNRDTKAKVKAHGASTLQPEHVSIDGSKITFSFTGKKGVAIKQTIDNELLARNIGERLGKPGPLFDTDDSKVRDYLHSIDGVFKVKDFRTAVATATALSAIKSIAPPKTEAEFKAHRLQVGKVVSQKLGNTPTVALASYIPPEVFTEWQTNLKTAA